MTDSKTFTAVLARRIGRDRKDVDSFLMGLSPAIQLHCADLDPVAIPGFGTFAAEKHDEQIITDHSTGRLMLLPPEIELTFHPGTKLRTQIEESANSAQ